MLLLVKKSYTRFSIAESCNNFPNYRNLLTIVGIRKKSLMFEFAKVLI